MNFKKIKNYSLVFIIFLIVTISFIGNSVFLLELKSTLNYDDESINVVFFKMLSTTSFTAVMAFFLLKIVFDKIEKEINKYYKKIEEEKRRSQTLWDLSLTSIFVTRKKEIININGVAEKTFGYSLDDLEGKNPLEIVHPDDRSIVANNMKKNYALSYEARVLTKKGETKTVLIEAKNIAYGGDVVRIINIKDLTREKRLKKEIENKDIEFKNALELAGDPVAIVDGVGEFLFVNNAFCELFEYSKNELSSLKCFDLTVRDDHAESKKNIEKAFNGYVVTEHIKKCRTKNGNILTVTASYSLVEGADEVILILKNISKSIEIQEELKEQVEKEVVKNREKDHILMLQSRQAVMGEMIANIAHQWRQPLNALSLHISFFEISMSKDKVDKEKVGNTINKCNILIENMSKTIDDFRNFFKPNKKKRDFCVNESIEKALMLSENTITTNEIEVHFHSEHEVHLCGYENEFAQVILNLINNAKDIFIERDSNYRVLNISINDKVNEVEVIFEDSGGGIPEDVLTKIFDPYFTTKEEGQGTGVGLYMSKKIIEESMDGKMEVTNSALGPYFTLLLPKNINNS